MTNRRVAITGLGPVSPIGIGKQQFTEAIKNGNIGIKKITAFVPDNFKSQIAGQLPDDFKCRDYVPKSYRKSIKVMARDIELAVAAADIAIKDARITTKAIDPDNVDIDPTRLSVNIGAGLICADLNELTFALYSAIDENGEFSLKKWGNIGMNNLTPLWLLKYLPNMLSCHVTIIHDAQAPSNAIVCGEASGHLALSEAFNIIKHDKADVCLTGGAESKINPMSLMRQDLMNRLTHSHNDSPESAVRPFDADRDGTAVSEGGAVIVLEDMERAKSRNANIYAEVIGTGASYGTDNNFELEQDGTAITIAIKKALKSANINANDIDLVIGFAPGLKIQDKAEASAIKQTLGDDVPVTSIKGQIGCNGAGSGALDIAIAAIALREGFIPKTINHETPDTQCQINVVTEYQDKEINTVMTIGYSLSGGQVSAVVLKKYEQ